MGKFLAETRRYVRKLLILLGLAVVLPTFSTPASASEHGCRCLLCLANPNGPMAIPECVADILQLFYDLAHLNPFPSCEMSGSANAKNGYSYFDECPEGTTALAYGAIAVQGAAGQTYAPMGFGGYSGPSFVTGLGTGEGYTPSAFMNSSDENWNYSYGPPPTQKQCVGRQVGTTSVAISSGEGNTYVDAPVYDQIVAMDKVDKPNYIDVFVDGKLFRRVRW